MNENPSSHSDFSLSPTGAELSPFESRPGSCEGFLLRANHSMATHWVASPDGPKPSRMAIKG